MLEKKNFELKIKKKRDQIRVLSLVVSLSVQLLKGKTMLEIIN
jgi:hypothetical protein